MTFKQKLREVGNSQGFLIQKVIRTTTNINLGDIVKIKVKKEFGTEYFENTAKVRKIGTSLGVMITKADTCIINAKVGDYLLIEISKKEMLR